jgi:Protein of unknown function (DUF2798)
MSRLGGAHDSNPFETGGGGRLRVDPKFSTVLLPAVMAAAMSLVMSLVDTIVRLGLAPALLSTWLGSFAIGVVVPAPTAILIGPAAQGLVGQFTGGQRADRGAVPLPEPAQPVQRGQTKI